MQNPIEEIKNRLDVVDVVRGYIKLKKAGANYQALCPFHSEKKPSFFVSPSRQMWKCFGCGRGHSMFDFIMQIEGVEFGDALRILAQKAGVELKPIRPELKTQRQRLYEICELGCKFFEKQLEQSAKGKKVQAYLVKRGVNQESRSAWRLGYAPEKWHGLGDFLMNTGYQKDEILRAGLNIKSEKGNYYDRFRSRIMFPIFDLNSQVIGFTGRILPGQEIKAGKYMNTPATLLYNKSRILYGLNQAKVDIRKNNACILVEGNVDVILSHQAGIKNLVATCGTALTPFQLNILKRYSDNLVLAFDMDIAGDTATKKGIDLAQARGFNIKVAVLPQGKDPAEVINENLENWKKFLANAKSILDFYFNNAFAMFDKKAPEGKTGISKILLPVFKRIPNKILRFHWVQKLAQELNVREKDILDELEKAKIEIQDVDKPIQTVPVKTRQEILEEILISLILKDFQNMEFLKEQDCLLFSQAGQDILSALKNTGADFNKLKTQLSPENFELLNVISLQAEINTEPIDYNEEFNKCLNRIRSLNVKEQLKQISGKIKQAENQREWTQIKTLTEKFNILAKQLNA